MTSPITSRSPDRALWCLRFPAAPGAVHLLLVGQLDLVTADHARREIREAQAAAPRLICDLGDVWFVDIAGLRVLLDAAAHARRSGLRLTVVNSPPLVPRMLRLLGLDGALPLRPRREPKARPASVYLRFHIRAPQRPRPGPA